MGTGGCCGVCRASGLSWLGLSGIGGSMGVCWRSAVRGEFWGGRGGLISTFVCFLTAVVWLVYGGGGGGWALGYVSTQIWDFSNISLFSKFLSLKWFGNSRENSYQVCYSRYHVSFYLWLIGSLLKHCKVPKYYNQDCSLMFSEHHRLCSQISESLNFRINETLGI